MTGIKTQNKNQRVFYIAVMNINITLGLGPSLASVKLNSLQTSDNATLLH